MISFIILHYNNIDDTCECIESIMAKCKDKNFSIIVVDNNSLNSIDEKRIRKYTNDIIKNKENLGFAKANNLGAKYAIKKYNSDFLCVINNDTLILDDDFVDEIYSCYAETKFDMMGPRIITSGGESVNPFPVYKDIVEINKAIRKTKMLIKIYKNCFLRKMLQVYVDIKHKIFKPIPLQNGKKSEYGVALHGCAIVFSKKYYKKFGDVFYGGTFLYHEEEFLEYRRKSNNLVSYYDSKLRIFHKEGASLNKKFDNNYFQKNIFRNEQILISLQLLKKVYEQGE